MNKFQRRESKAVRRTIAHYPIRYQMGAKYKIVRRNFRKTARMLIKANKEAHKKALSKAVNDYIRQDLFNTIYVAEAIEVKNE